MDKSPVSSRRAFFAHLTALGVAGLFAEGAGHASDWSGSLGASPAVPLAELRAEDFLPRIGQTFVLRDGERCFEAQLDRVRSRPANTSRRPQFSVIFRVNRSEPLPHQIYTVENASMGRYSLFLGAVGQPSGGTTRLEAAFA